MSDLAAFLRARLDEDEAAAKAALKYVPWTDKPWYSGEIHIARHSPARVLRQAEAMRKIVNSLEADLRAGARTDLTQGGQIALTYAARTLAAIWRDHPDFDPAWNPETAKPPPAGGMAGGG